VHRDGHVSMDVSADLAELARTPVAVVCAGVKSILDIPRTLEVLVFARNPGNIGCECCDVWRVGRFPCVLYERNRVQEYGCIAVSDSMCGSYTYASLM
jgi:Indigoidine synthase A like protein